MLEFVKAKYIDIYRKGVEMLGQIELCSGSIIIFKDETPTFEEFEEILKYVEENFQ